MEGAGESAGLEGEALLQRQGEVSKVNPLDHTGMHKKKKHKGRRDIKEGGKIGDRER